MCILFQELHTFSRKRMAEKQVCARVLIFAYVLSQCRIIKSGGVRFKTEDIRKFVATKQVIWTWTTTANRKNLICKADHMQSFTQGHIIFQRIYVTLPDLAKIVKNYEGLFPRKQANLMQLVKGHLMNYTHVAKEKLIYDSTDYHCAVIKVTPVNHGYPPYFDLRIWNFTVRMGPHVKCIRRFMKHGGRGHDIYEPKCQRLLNA
uniref:Lipocalin n=1 Tax=Rhipicephalus zambeziensis TaxID=60191 RepID=A0A224YBK1_9ACAR